MPTYVYKDLETGQTFEMVQSITEPALKQNPETGTPVKRIIQPVGIAFKGSGFYVTDSRKSESNKTKDSKKSEVKKPEGSSKESAQSKSNTKTDSKLKETPANKS